MPPPAVRSVGIIGLGTAGTAAAIFLARAGHKVTVFERTGKADLEHPVGAGIGIQPIGLTVLKKLGVLDEVLQHGSQIDSLLSTTQSGRTVLDLSYSDFRPGLFGLGLHRSVLFTSLYNAALREPNISIETGARITSCDVGPKASIEVEGRKEGPFDLLLVADGRDSVRKSIEGAVAHESPYPYGCLWTILPDHDGTFTSSPVLQQKLHSTKTMLGFMPTGRTHAMSLDDPKLVSLFWSLKIDSVAQARQEGLDAWKAKIISLEPKSEGLLQGLTNFDQLIPAAYSDTFMPRLYLNESCAFLGDCAHATSPQLGQGANLALVDAWVLSESMKSHAKVSDAIRHYDEMRKWRLRFYQMNSRLLTPVFQSDSRLSKPIGVLRDAFMGPLCHFPPTRHQMLTTLCGAQNNGIPWTTIPEEEFMGYLP